MQALVQEHLQSLLSPFAQQLKDMQGEIEARLLKLERLRCFVVLILLLILVLPVAPMADGSQAIKDFSRRESEYLKNTDKLVKQLGKSSR